MNFPRRLRFRCPYCRAVFARSLSVVRLGPGGVRHCEKCGRVFADGSIEWLAATRSQKKEYLFPPVLWPYLLIGLAVDAALGLGELPRWHDVLIVALYGDVLLVIPLIAYWLRCLREIRTSDDRYRRRVLAHVGFTEDPTRVIPK